jgi:hypothetical protein
MKDVKRIVIVKVGNEKFIKYEHVDNLIRFTAFLDTKFPDWRYMNVFDRKTHKQIASFTKKNRPSSPNLM